jgi:hypothetical protein
MTAHHTRLPNDEHTGRVLAVRLALLRNDPLAIVNLRQRAKQDREYRYGEGLVELSRMG